MNIQTIRPELIRTYLKPRDPNSHKGSFGTGLLLAGSKGMAGAAILSGMGALYSGIGILNAVVPKDINSVYQSTLYEAITYCYERISEISDILEERTATGKINAIAIGPGFGVNVHKRTLMDELIGMYRQPLVIDADGLNDIKNPEVTFSKRHNDIVLTPHPGEFAKLTGLSKEDVLAHQEELVLRIASEWNVIVLLKGHRTLIAHPDGRLTRNETGCVGMAKGGSGDILTGILLSFLAQGMETYDATCIAAHVHGLAGEYATKEKGEYGVQTRDIAQAIPYVMKDLVGQ